MHESSVFVTLTYDDEHLPLDGSLNYRHFQLFMKRLRKEVGKVRFYMCGEYGEENKRPHFHAILYGVDFPDKELWLRSSGGSMVYRSPTLERLWPFGFSSIGDVTFQSAAYVARYVMKKVTGFNADDHYRRVNSETGEVYYLVPEFNKMSLKPGIGAEWLAKYKDDVYPHDYVVINGAKCKPPRYYDKKFKSENALQFEDVEYNRYRDGRERVDDNTDDRLKVKERVAMARVNQLKRSL